MKIGFYKQNFTRYKTIQKKADLNNTNNVFYNDRVVKSGLNQLANINKTFINFTGQANCENQILNINFSRIKEIPIDNLRILSSKLVTGSTFSDKSEEDFNKLVAAGIKAMIDLRTSEDTNLQQKCNNSKICYLKVPLDGVVLLNDENFFYRNKDKSLHVKDDFIEMLKIFFNTINNSTCYMACRYGIDRTNIGILLNYFFNKGYNGITPEILCWDCEKKETKTNQDISLIKKIYKAMTDEQKAKLGLSDIQESTRFKNKLLKLKSKNHT